MRSSVPSRTPNGRGMLPTALPIGRSGPGDCKEAIDSIKLVTAVILRGAFVALALPVLTAAPVPGPIPVVELDEVVHPVSAAHVVSAIRNADRDGAPLVIVRMNTPGGLDTSMRQIVDAMLAARTPVAVFVGPSARAASAGFVIAVAADVAAMAPAPTSARPSGLRPRPMDDVMSKKVAQDAAAYVRSKAEQRGRNVEMAEKAVLESRSFTEREALELKLIDLVAADVPELLRALEAARCADSTAPPSR